MTTAVVVVSGGLDSVTLLHHVTHPIAREAVPPIDELHVISFNYGQRHVKELDFARWHAKQLGGEHHVVDLTSITSLLSRSGSSLVADSEVPEGHYGEENMKATVVPNRNMIMASIAAGLGVAVNADFVALGVHAGDHFIYPDCRPAFFAYLNYAVAYGNEGFGPFTDQAIELENWIRTPFINWTKNDIANRAVMLNIDFETTWSCYKGGEIHCGKCGTCVERLEAIASTGCRDKTEYEDKTYWKEVVQKS